MCLYNNPTEVQKVLKGRRKTIECYKILKNSIPNKLYSPFRRFAWYSGINESNCKSKRPSFSIGYINKGIHTFRSSNAARKYIKLSGYFGYQTKDQLTIVKVIGKKEDLVGASTDQLVFKQVTLTKVEFEKATKSKSKPKNAKISSQR